MKTSLPLTTISLLLIFGGLLSSISGEEMLARETVRPMSLRPIPISTPGEDKHSPLGTFNLSVPWLSENVICDGSLDISTEWSDAARYDISDTSGQYDGIKDPPGTVYLYVKQDSFGVWFAVIDRADSLLMPGDQFCLFFDDNHDHCFPYSYTNEGFICLGYTDTSTTPWAQWHAVQDTNCNAAGYDCRADFFSPPVNISLPCYAVGMTDGHVSWEVRVPYSAIVDHFLQVADPVHMDIGLFMYTFDLNVGHYNGEWPSQGRSSTWTEPCYYGNCMCQGYWYFKPGYPDYAIRGMPDFDQKQDQWDKPPGSGNWTYCGPTAIANCLWWFDSKYQWLINPTSPLPPTISDDFGLVTAYGAYDDHDLPNVRPLIEDLAWYMDTDGQRTGTGIRGTSVFRMEAAVAEWQQETGTDTIFYEHTRKSPSFHWIESEIERCEDVILLLGFWQYLEEWVRVGGHYVTCAGVNSDSLAIAFSDPYFDMAGMGWPGRVGNGILTPHPPAPHGPGVHNDAGNVSHDFYRVLRDSLSPGGPWSLPEYPREDSIFFDLQGANCPPEFRDQQSTYVPGYPVHTEIEYAVAISPIPDCWHFKGEYPDYAPDGMPDFDQNQHEWTAYCGPAALANCLWWYDSKYQWLTVGGNPPPPFVQDDYSLITTYVAGWDDHSFQVDPAGYDNVQYLIEDLATYLGTDPVSGTKPVAMQQGIRQWLMDKGLDDVFYEHTFIDSTQDPDFFSIIEKEIECCQDVILLLGFWQELQAGYWVRVGGHYVTCAGVCSDSLMIMFSDPDFDQAPISYSDSTKWHNNAALVSHDVYTVAEDSPSPGGYWWIPGYPEEVGFRHAFENCPNHLSSYQEYPSVGIPIHTEIEAAVMVSPFVKPAAVDSLWIYPDGPVDPTVWDIRLVWTPVTEDTAGCPAVPIYVVYRDTVPSFTPGPATEYVTTMATEYEDANAAGDTSVNHYYYVTARAGTLESAPSRCVGEVDKYLMTAPKSRGAGAELKKR